MSALMAQYYYSSGWRAEHIAALTIPIAGGVVLLLVGIMLFAHLRRRMAHEQQLALIQRGLTTSPPMIAPRRSSGVAWALIGTLVPFFCLAAAVGTTAMVFNFGERFTRIADDEPQGDSRAFWSIMLLVVTVAAWGCALLLSLLAIVKATGGLREQRRQAAELELRLAERALERMAQPRERTSAELARELDLNRGTS